MGPTDCPERSVRQCYCALCCCCYYYYKIFLRRAQIVHDDLVMHTLVWLCVGVVQRDLVRHLVHKFNMT